MKCHIQLVNFLSAIRPYINLPNDNAGLIKGQ